MKWVNEMSGHLLEANGFSLFFLNFLKFSEKVRIFISKFFYKAATD